MTSEERQRMLAIEEQERLKQESTERLADDQNDWIKTVDVARLFLRSTSWVRKMLRLKLVPEYALPVRIYPNQRGWMWSKAAIMRWRDEIMEGRKR